MPFVKDENGNHIFDSEGNKITFNVVYETNHYQPYTHRESLHINANNHVDTENRNIIIKDGVNTNHAVSKGQLDSVNTTIRSEITTLIQSSIQTALNKFSSDFRKALIEFRNKQIRGRVGRKSLTIPKTNYTWIKLLDASEFDGVTTLQEIIIQNVYIKRTDRYHHAKSDLVANSFDQLEFFFKDDFSAYYCYFNNHPSDWDMGAFLEYIKIPKEINVENSDEEVNE